MCIINGHGFLKMIIYTYTRIVVLIYIRSLCTLAHDEADIRITQCRSSIKLYSPCIYTLKAFLHDEEKYNQTAFSKVGLCIFSLRCLHAICT